VVPRSVRSGAHRYLSCAPIRSLGALLGSRLACLQRHARSQQRHRELERRRRDAWSSQRHWHSHEDEFIWIVEGEFTLVIDSGEELVRAGDCAPFRRGVEDWHHLINKSARPARVLEIGNSDAQDCCVYSDIDMVVGPGSEGYRHRDGTPYSPKPG
jgi:mannose-6-phosphate isomerase-like protein (cupin superfamily)